MGVEALRRMPAVRGVFRKQLPLDDARLVQWVAFWLVLHDLGKFSEAFQSQCPDVFMAVRGREPDPAKPYTRRHDSLGLLFWKGVLRDVVIKEEWFGPRSDDLAWGLDHWVRACTGHHGQPPAEDDSWTQHFDTRQDREAALAFTAEARALFIDSDLAGEIAAFDPTHFLKSSSEISWWLAGLVVLADWLGSNTLFFKYRDRPVSLADYWSHAQAQAGLALKASGVMPPRSATEMSFGALFPALVAPSPLQHWASTIELHDGPQIHLLEDVTGAGKTEAALMLTHRLLAGGQAESFFVALPTMATANAMYGRISAAYARLFDDAASLVLAHGQRALVDEFAATVLPADVAENDARQLDETASARCSAWLADHNKRALLSPAGVGTIDQALLAVLHSKHQSLRLLGLVHKMLVVDEVHACDDYMLGVLKILLTFHARAGGSAILLSATLPQRVKQGLLAAFAEGVGQQAPCASDARYPLATSWPASASATLAQSAIATRADVQRRVAVRTTADSAEVHELVARELAAGRCVCWVRNTVADAVQAFEHFKSTMPQRHVLLFHARFALRDRLDMERRVLDTFGRASSGSQRAGRLLIATQVVEQSLDVDFDVLVSDLAPIDRIIQRAGRLRRHRRDALGNPLVDAAAPDQRGEPCLWVLTPPWTEEPEARWFKAAFPKGAAVYPHHASLWLTARALREGGFTMPDDARRLVEGVFGADVPVPPGLDANAVAAEGQAYAALAQAQMNTLKLAQGYQRGGIDWWGEAQTPSRLGEATSQIVLARFEDGVLRPLFDGAHGWAYSSLRVSERLIAATAPATGAALQRALEAASATLPAQGRWCVVLPLVRTAAGWVGDALAAPRKGQPARRLTWRYDPATGLHLLPTDDAPGGIPAQEDPDA